MAAYQPGQLAIRFRVSNHTAEPWIVRTMLVVVEVAANTRNRTDDTVSASPDAVVDPGDVRYGTVTFTQITAEHVAAWRARSVSVHLRGEMVVQPEAGGATTTIPIAVRHDMATGLWETV